MDDTQLDDLKQFIAATVSQATADMATKRDIANMATKDDIANMATKDDIRALDAKLSNMIENLETKVDTIADAHAEDHENYEQRLTKLETKVA